MPFKCSDASSNITNYYFPAFIPFPAKIVKWIGINEDVSDPTSNDTGNVVRLRLLNADKMKNTLCPGARPLKLGLPPV